MPVALDVEEAVLTCEPEPPGEMAWLSDIVCVGVCDGVLLWLEVAACDAVVDPVAVSVVVAVMLAVACCEAVDPWLGVAVPVTVLDWVGVKDGVDDNVAVCDTDGNGTTPQPLPSWVVQFSCAPNAAEGTTGHKTVAMPPDVGCASWVVTHGTAASVARTGGTGARAVIVHVVELATKSNEQESSVPVMLHCAAGMTLRTTWLGVFSAIQSDSLSLPQPNA